MEDLITYVIPDFNAVAHFQRDFIQANEFHLAEESTVLGIEIYLVEQWVHGRKIGTVVSTFTGDSDSKVAVVRFTIMKKQARSYPLRFQEYLNEVMLAHGTLKRSDLRQEDSQNHPNPSPIQNQHNPNQNQHNQNQHQHNPNQNSNDSYDPLNLPGFLFVTNMARLPSNLNLIPIPSGDVRTVFDAFIVNSNLKKFQCTGRSVSLVENKISDASEDKFRQMYGIYNSVVPIKFAVKELANLIQISLFYFDLLDAKYCDGLVCSKTEEAIANWWNLIGLPHFNTKPSATSSASSRTVAAIISFVLSVKLRLQLVGGCDVPKDVFDYENFMISIGQFQKQTRLEKRRKLDLDTLNKLFSVTSAKLMAEDPRSIRDPRTYLDSKNYREFKKLTSAVKTTVQDHIGSSSSNVLLPSDVETLDLDHLITKMSGKTLHRLWNTRESRNYFSYRFVSLKSAITSPTLTSTDVSRYSRGLNRVKRLQNRYPLRKTDAPHINSFAPSQTTPAPEDKTNIDESLDSLLKPSEPPPQQDSASTNSQTSKPKESWVRRNSYPFIKQEVNLNTVQNVDFKPLKKCPSHSCLQTSTGPCTTSYLTALESFIRLDHLKSSVNEDNLKLTKKYEKVNVELIKLHNSKTQMMTNKNKVIDEQLLGNLDFKMDDLDATLDRVMYETRIVVQRVNELEDNLSLLDSKMSELCMAKFSKIVDHLIVSHKFCTVFDDQERQDLVYKLTGSRDPKPEPPGPLDGIFRLLVIFLYDMINSLFQMFHFDRSKMNLDRIRNSWRKLDPNRQYINKAYNYVGRELALETTN